MKSVILFSFFTIVFSGPVVQEMTSQEDITHFLYKNENGDILVEDLTIPEVNLTASASDVTFNFFCKKNSRSSINIRSNEISLLKETDFNVKKDTLFIIHGWKNSHESKVNSLIRENTLNGHDINVFVVDWSPIASKTYISAQGCVPKVGGFVADFVRSLQQNFKLNLSKVKFVGHSLGAHVCGCAGTALGGQVSRIVGLDPAGPLFSLSNKKNRLDKSSAKYVEVIHTNGGMLGFNDQLGHSDYYPNGGRTQPGCGVDLTGSCSHGRSYEYYAESLSNNRFEARECGSIKDYTSGKCNNAKRSFMCPFIRDTSAHGKFFLETNSKSPFAKG
ncbi:inactive pancreatic lipase-related protein 1 [Leptinotarsa decemlineata]|uniref:inactive pancreatic lipase-related protein 1 n=1 Tax=Leptinotarsa decemlineata TaxID=7539 RepID=UPI003D30ABF1